MLENIPLIASVISALTALTTSLRALGKSRENMRSNIKSKIATGSRLGTLKYRQRHSLLIYIISTIIWLVLSVVFVMPLFIQKWSGGFERGMIAFLVPFLLLVILICFIWQKTIYMKNSDQ